MLGPLNCRWVALLFLTMSWVCKLFHALVQLNLGPFSGGSFWGIFVAYSHPGGTILNDLCPSFLWSTCWLAALPVTLMKLPAFSLLLTTKISVAFRFALPHGLFQIKSFLLDRALELSDLMVYHFPWAKSLRPCFRSRGRTVTWISQSDNPTLWAGLWVGTLGLPLPACSLALQ